MILSPKTALSDDKCNALIVAADNCDYETLDILLGAGTDPNCLGARKGSQVYPAPIRAFRGGPTLYPRPRKCNSFEILELFISKGYDVNLGAKNPSGKFLFTVFHDAAYLGNLDAIKLLLQHGADPYIKNYMGATALDLAVSRKHTAVVKAIVSHKSGSVTSLNVSISTDSIILKNGDVLSGNIITDKYKLHTSYGDFVLNKKEISIIEFEGSGKNIDSVLLKSGDKLSGDFLFDLIEIKLGGSRLATIDKEKIKKIQMKK